MHCHSTGSGFFDNLRNFHRIYATVVKSFSDFYRHRLFNCLYQRIYNLIDQLWLFHQCGTFPVFYYLRHRTSHVDIQKRKRPLFNLFCHLTQDLRIGSKQLQRYRLFFRVDGQKTFCISIVIKDPFCADHFHAQKSRALFFAEQTERQVCYTCHRS